MIYQRGVDRYWNTFVCGVLAILFTTGAVIGISESGPSLPWTGQIATAVIAALAAAVLSVRTARAGIFVEFGTVIFRNALRTHRVQVTDIKSFLMPESAEYPCPFPWRGLAVVLKGGRIVRSSVYAPRAWESPEFARPVVDALNDYLKASSAHLSRTPDTFTDTFVAGR